MADWVDNYHDPTLADVGGEYIRKRTREESFFRRIVVSAKPEEKPSAAPPKVKECPRG